jgi:hypothetical protein
MQFEGLRRTPGEIRGWDLGFWVGGLGIRVLGIVIRIWVLGSGIGVWGLGFRQ